MIQRIFNRYLMQKKSVTTLKGMCKENEIFLTFDDGPEPGITEFILDELDKYGFKAMFFCTGRNAELYPELIKKIKQRGHDLGNHTYTHIKAYECLTSLYVQDTIKANNVLNVSYFRPPNGCLTISTWLKLKKYKIIYWSRGSNDWCHSYEKLEAGLHQLINSNAGDIILFHFCNELGDGTRYILPKYLKWMHNNGFKSLSIAKYI